MLSVLFVLLFYIAHCCIDIEDRSLSGLYFNTIILSYLILRVYESGLFSFRNSKRSLHLVKFLFKNNKYYPLLLICYLNCIIQFSKRTILCHRVLSVLAYLPLQNFCVFPIFESYYQVSNCVIHIS
jgi:hypothetical protein